MSKASKMYGERKVAGRTNGFLAAIGILLCIIFAVVLVGNLCFLVKAKIAPGEPPSVLGITPITVLTGDMSGNREGHLEAGDLLLVKKVDPRALDEGDVISFVTGGSVTTHRIIEITYEEGRCQFITKGDANNAEDEAPVTEAQLVGRYLFRIPKLGEVSLFLRKPVGLLLFVLVPLIAFILIDALTRRSVYAKQEEELSPLALENERLRMMLEGYMTAQPAAATEGFYIGEPPEADETLLSAIYDGEVTTPPQPPVMEAPQPVPQPVPQPAPQPAPQPVAAAPKAQGSGEVPLEEILAFARSIEANRK